MTAAPQTPRPPPSFLFLNKLSACQSIAVSPRHRIGGQFKSRPIASKVKPCQNFRTITSRCSRGKRPGHSSPAAPLPSRPVPARTSAAIPIPRPRRQRLRDNSTRDWKGPQRICSGSSGRRSSCKSDRKSPATRPPPPHDSAPAPARTESARRLAFIKRLTPIPLTTPMFTCNSSS